MRHRNEKLLAYVMTRKWTHLIEREYARVIRTLAHCAEAAIHETRVKGRFSGMRRIDALECCDYKSAYNSNDLNNDARQTIASSARGNDRWREMHDASIKYYRARTELHGH